MLQFKFNQIIITFMIFISGLPYTFASTREGDISSAKELGTDIAHWWKNQPTPKSKSIAIALVKVSSNLDPQFSEIVEAILIKNLAQDGVTRVTTCPECKTPQIKVHQDRLIVTKGFPDQQTLMEIGKKIEAESFLHAEVIKTATSLTIQATLIQTSTGVVLAAQDFSIPNISLADTGMQFTFSLGIQYELNQENKVALQPLAPLLFDLNLHDQVGSTARAGINLGVLLNTSTGPLAYFMPTYGWKFRLGRSEFFLAPALQAGLVYWDKAIGVGTGPSLDFFLSKNFFVGGKGLVFFPVYNLLVNRIGYFAGFHVGFALGR